MNAAQSPSVSNDARAGDRALAVVFDAPERLSLSQVELVSPGDDDVVVDVQWSGISTGTERLLWSGRMPPFPGMGYPLVPGYESVGRIRSVGANSGYEPGECVFVPGSRGFKDVRGLFGGAASQLVVPGARAIRVDGDAWRTQRAARARGNCTSRDCGEPGRVARPHRRAWCIGQAACAPGRCCGWRTADGLGAKRLAPQWCRWLSGRRSCKRHAARLSRDLRRERRRVAARRVDRPVGAAR